MVNQGSNKDSYYDYILVRKFTDPEPSVTAGTESTPPSAGSFGFRKSITIDRTKISDGSCGTTISNFPMLFSVTDADLATTVNGGDVASYDAPSKDPRDIIFRALDDDTCGGPGTSPCTLDHEIEKYVDTSGEMVAWVRIPSVNTNAASSDTVVYIYYCNSDITSSTQNVSGVWDSNYVGVWHLDETSGDHADSTLSNNTGTPYGGVNQNGTAPMPLMQQMITWRRPPLTSAPRKPPLTSGSSRTGMAMTVKIIGSTSTNKRFMIGIRMRFIFRK